VSRIFIVSFLYNKDLEESKVNAIFQKSHSFLKSFLYFEKQESKLKTISLTGFNSFLGKKELGILKGINKKIPKSKYKKAKYKKKKASQIKKEVFNNRINFDDLY
jgi:hypothetical protein